MLEQSAVGILMIRGDHPFAWSCSGCVTLERSRCHCPEPSCSGLNTEWLCKPAAAHMLYHAKEAP